MPTRKAVIITGSSGGIGQALCHQFRGAGYLVIGTDCRRANEVVCDLFLEVELAELVNEAEAQRAFLGDVARFLDEQDATLNALVNNAAQQVTGNLEDLTIRDFLSSQEINVAAPFILAKLFADDLRSAAGSIVNIGSVHAHLTKPGFCAYSTSKAALSGLSRALALELAPDVTVNTISPGATRTEMLLAGFREEPDKYQELQAFHPVGRIANPMEIARVVLFLCSEDARFITGADIPVDGGIGGRLHDPI